MSIFEDIKALFFAASLIALLGTPVAAQNARGRAIELSALIEAFMLRSGESPDWSMGAGNSTPQIVWTSVGVEGEPDCGVYVACRKGTVRVSIAGEEIQHLRQRLEPIEWGIFMTSREARRHGPQQIDITPRCDTVDCEFGFEWAFRNKGFTLSEKCKAGKWGWKQTAYEVRKGGKITYVLVNDNQGSGGSSVFLTLLFTAPKNLQSLCDAAK